MSDLPVVPPPLGPWAEDAACLHADPEAFFPEKGGSSTAAMQMCADCPVADDCLDYAMQSPVVLYGIWGGTSERERQRMRRNLRQREAS